MAQVRHSTAPNAAAVITAQLRRQQFRRLARPALIVTLMVLRELLRAVIYVALFYGAVSLTKGATVSVAQSIESRSAA